LGGRDVKKVYAKDLTVGAQIAGRFCVIEKRYINYNRNGVPAAGLALMLGDRTGKVSAVAWHDSLVADNTFRQDDIVAINGRVQDYRGEKQIYLEDIRKADPAQVDAADFCAPSPRPVGEMWHELMGIVDTVINPFLNSLLEMFFSDEEMSTLYRQVPAGRDVHHAYVGGLLHHTLEVVAYAEQMVKLQGARLNRDLLITGAIFHDVAKVREYEVKAFTFEFTDQGKMLGHLVMGAELVGGLCDRKEGFPAALRDELKHMILSHHGLREWGSPEAPKTANAMALHLADLTSGRLAQVEKVVDETLKNGERWSAWDKRLERNILAATWEVSQVDKE